MTDCFWCVITSFLKPIDLEGREDPRDDSIGRELVFAAPDDANHTP